MYCLLNIECIVSELHLKKKRRNEIANSVNMTTSKTHIHRFLGVEDVKDGQRIRLNPVFSFYRGEDRGQGQISHSLL